MDCNASPAESRSFFATLASPVSFAKLCFFLDTMVDTVNLVFTFEGLQVLSVDSTRL